MASPLHKLKSFLILAENADKWKGKSSLIAPFYMITRACPIYAAHNCKKPVFWKIITDRSRNVISAQLQGLLTGNALLHRLDERETLYTINFTKISQNFFI